MCDPTLIMTGVSLAAGIAGSIGNSMSQQSAQKQQEAAYNSWATRQQRIRQEESARQEADRKQAEVSQQQGVTDIAAENQKARQSAEEKRLADYYNGQTQQVATQPDAPQSVSDAAIAGTPGGSDRYKEDLAKKIASSTAAAKQRLTALATAQSYGDSFGGLGTTNPLLQQTAGAGIDRANEFRRGSLGAYNTERAVDPLQYSYTPGAFGSVAPQLLAFGAKGLGGALAGTTPTTGPKPITWGNSFTQMF